MSRPRTLSTLKPFLTLFFCATLLAACSDSNDNRPSDPPGDPDYPDYTIVTLEAGDDLEERALEALITAEPRTIVQLPAGTYNFVGELSSSVDNIVLRGTGMDADELRARNARRTWREHLSRDPRRRAACCVASSCAGT